MHRSGKNRFSVFLLFLFLILVSASGKSEGTKELNTNSVQSTELYICNDFVTHCSTGAGLRSQFAAYDNTQSATDAERLYFVTINTSEVVYLGFKGGGLTNPATPLRHIVFRIKNQAGTIVLAEQNLPTSGTGYISTFAQALNGPNALILTPPYNGYDALVFTPPTPGTYYIEFSARRDDNSNFYIGNFELTLFDITIGNTVTHLEKPGRLYSKSWQFYETSNFYSKNYIISDDSIVTSAQFSGMSGGHWIQYCNQTGCGSTSANWIVNRKSLYNQQALYPQYKIFLNEPEPVPFPPASSLGQLVAPLPYGVQNCLTGHVLFHVAVNKPGNVEILLTFPAPYLPRTLNQAVVTGDNLFDWDGLDGTTPTGLPVLNNTVIQFTVKYINGLTNLPLYDVETNSSGMTVALVSPAGSTPAVYWDDTNIPGGANNSNPPGCTSPPGCHSWSSSWGDLNTVNTWWYNVSTTTAPASITVFRNSQVLVFNQQPPLVYCANTGGHIFSVTPDPNTEVYHWSYTPPAGVTISQLSSGSYTVTVSFGPTASSGVIHVYGTNANCAFAGPTTSMPITLNPNPIPTLAGPVVACTGQTNATYTTESGKVNYQWNVSSGGTITGGGTSTSNTVTVTWNTAGAQSVSVNYQSGVALCTSPMPTVLNVTVNARPVPTLTGNTSVCAGTSGVVYTTAAGKTNYVWAISSVGVITAGGTSTSNTATVTWNTAGAQTISVNYTEPVTLCAGLSPTTLNVTVNSRPVPSLTGSTLVCVNTGNVVYTTDMGKLNYLWTISPGGTITAGGTSTSSTATVSWNTAGAQSITVTYTDPVTLCAATSPTILNVSVNNLPTPTFLSGSNSACLGVPGSVYTTEPGMANYLWVITGGTITLGGTATDSFVTVTWDNLGAQSVSVNYSYPFTTCTSPVPTLLTVNVKPLPTPSFISGNNSVCRGVIGNVYTTQAGMMNYAWSVTGGSITAGGDLTSDFATITWDEVGLQSISINYTDPATSCMAAMPTTFPVTVKSLPVPSFISGENSVCLNTPDHMYATQPGMNNYFWNVTGGSVTSGGSSSDNLATVTWNVVGSQSIEVGYTDPVTQCAAAFPTSYDVTVKDLPIPSFISGDNPVCQGATGTGYTTQPGMSNYAWLVTGGSITAGGTAASNSAAISWNVVGSQLITVSYTDPATLCTASTPTLFPITVKPLPIPTIAGPAAACLNTTSSQYNTEPGMTNYVWTVPQGTITTGATPDIIHVVWNTLGTQSMTVTYTGLNGCDAATPSQKSVVVNTLPVPMLTGQTSVCTGIQTTYSTDPGMQNYTWIVPAGGSIISGGTASDHTITVAWTIPGMHNISVDYALGTGCNAAIPTSLAVTVYQSTPPEIQEIPPGKNCATFPTTYTTQPGMSGYSWTISSGGSIISSANTNVITVRWDATGAQWVMVNFTNTYGCTGQIPTQFNATVNPLPVTTITAGSGPDCELIPHGYQVPSDSGCTFNWAISPAGRGLVTAGQGSNAATIEWLSYGTAVISVAGTNNTTGCYASSSYTATVNPTPNPSFTPCFDLVTTPNAKKFIMRGATPFLPGQGVFSGNRVSLDAATGNYEFDPFGANAGTYPITYTYTNTFGCQASPPVVSITVQNNPFICGGNLTDLRDGQTYATATIGGKCWMAENLNFGTSISSYLPSTDNCTDEKYCQPADINCSNYGGLYQWEELMRYGTTIAAKGICPPEWHVPSEEEWQLLLYGLGTGTTPPDGMAGSFLKDPFLTGGFNALLSGLLYLNNTWMFTTVSLTGTMYWTSTQDVAAHAIARGVNTLNPSTSRYPGSKENSFSLRCVKDIL